MNDYWITAGNTDFDRKRLNLQMLPYPLAYYSPATAFGYMKELVLPSQHFNIELGVELAVRINKSIYQVDETEAEQAISDFFCCAGISNYYPQKKIYKPTPRDKATCEYYSRWYDSTNTLLEMNSIGLGEKSEIEVRMEGAYGGGQTFHFSLLHSPAKILSFLSSFTQLFSGTTICLGQCGRLEVSTVEKNHYNITIPQFGFEGMLTTLPSDVK